MRRQLKFPTTDYADTLDATLSAMASRCQKEKRLKILFVTLWAEKSPPDVLRHHVRVAKRTGYWQITARRGGGEKTGARSGHFGMFRNEGNSWTLFTTEHLDFLHGVIVPLIRSYHPVFSRVYLTSRDMRAILEELEGLTGAAILAKKAISYSHRKESEISYRRKPYWLVFDTAEREDEYVDKVEFLVEKQDGLHGFLSRDGVCKFYSGNTKSLTSLLKALSSVSLQRRSFFCERTRRPGSSHVYPIDVTFVEEVFHKPEDNVRFLTVLSRLSRSAMAVMHANPYVHVSLVDFYDGSAFDIFATRGNAVTVVPQVAASAFSLNRLCNHIFEGFHEGAIGEPVQTELTVRDFTI